MCTIFSVSDTSYNPKNTYATTSLQHMLRYVQTLNNNGLTANIEAYEGETVTSHELEHRSLCKGLKGVSKVAVCSECQWTIMSLEEALSYVRTNSKQCMILREVKYASI